jgi:hypothetical protein
MRPLVVVHCTYLLVLSASSFSASAAFRLTSSALKSRRQHRLVLAAQQPLASEARRKELLSRQGPYFNLNKQTGKIEFGATADLITLLSDDENCKQIEEWLSDQESLAMSIWDPIENLGDNVYRLQVMSLQFATLQLAPYVDVEMKTFYSTSAKQPIFTLQSVGFDPNIQVLPGFKVSAESLKILIEVSGQLRPSKDGKGVTGAIAFQTRGELPPLFRLLPEEALKAASDSINETIVNFAVVNFQKGAKEKYKEFIESRTNE